SDRTHRLGQTKTVTVYKLVCANSIEERVVEMAARKEQLTKDLLGSDTGSGAKRISAQEVLALLD
ncbi:DEAD/DEAH box helicase, partial [Myxococcota bacterium]|nr:DEAD/DEAH box helicase [Myxococcota bacterium]